MRYKWSENALTNTSGGITDRYDYDAYGNAHGFATGLLATVAATTPLLYTGEQHDPTLQQYYLRARYYDTSNGRFNRLDPFEGNENEPISLHKYMYAHGNPILYVDPSGEFSSLVELMLANSETTAQYVNRAMQVGRIKKSVNQIRTIIKAFNAGRRGADRIWDTVSTIHDLLELRDFDAKDIKDLKDLLVSRIHGDVTLEINLPKNMKRVLDNVTKTLGGTSNPVVAEWLGAAMAALTAHLLGYRTTSLSAGYHGIDSLMFDDNLKRFAVIEAKGGAGKLAPGQMRNAWIKDRLVKLQNRNKNPTPDGSKLDHAISRHENMWALVVSIDLRRNKEYAARLQTYPRVKAWGSPFE